MAFATTVPLWGVILSAAPLVVGLIAWLAVLGARVRSLEIEVKEIGKLRADIGSVQTQMAQVLERLEWIKERLAEKH